MTDDRQLREQPLREAALPGSKIHRAGFLWRAGAIGGIAALGSAGSQALAPIRVMAAGAGQFLGNIKTLGRNQALSYRDPKTGDPALLIRLASGTVVSYDAVCTHAGCTVGYDPVRQQMVCPCHGARYDPARGAKVVAGPAPQPLTSLAVHVAANGDVYALDGKPNGKKTGVLSKTTPTKGANGDDSGGEQEGRGRIKRRTRRHRGDN